MQELFSLAEEIGFSHVGYFDPSGLRTLPEVRDMCAAGRCRRYGRSWSCPPACGDLDYTEARMRAYGSGILVQTTARLEDDFDAESMSAAEKQHKAHFITFARQARILFPDCLPLSAGTCTVCRTCTYPDRPCRFPNRRLSSMEAYGLLVSEVCQLASLPYYYGRGTLTYTSCILLNKTEEAQSR